MSARSSAQPPLMGQGMCVRQMIDPLQFDDLVLVDQQCRRDPHIPGINCLQDPIIRNLEIMNLQILLHPSIHVIIDWSIYISLWTICVGSEKLHRLQFQALLGSASLSCSPQEHLILTVHSRLMRVMTKL